VPTSGGVYGIIEAAFGPLAGYVSGTLLWVCSVLACGAVADALGDVAATLFPQSLGGPVRGTAIVSVIGAVALVNIGGVTRGARLVSATTTLKLSPLVIFIVAGSTAVHTSNFAPTVQPDAQGFGRALILAVFALVGMETSLCASGEVARPNRTIPRALAIALVSTTILYVAIQVIAQGIPGASLATSKAPLTVSADRLNSVVAAGRGTWLLSGFGGVAACLSASHPAGIWLIAKPLMAHVCNSGHCRELCANDS
jgi:basic amino acid/polyamine antiporter, APA family